MACSIAYGDIVNSKVLRNIDLTTQFARHTLTITAENKGASSTSTYDLAVQNATNLANIRAESETGSALEVTAGDAKTGYTTYTVKLAIAAGKAVTFKVFLTYVASLKPFPSEITMTQHQLVRYYDNVYFYSPYHTNNQRTTVKLATSRVEGHNESPANKVSGDTITYGSYSDIKPLTTASLWVHYENNAPFLTVTKMVKEYEVSHWGNLAVEQAVDIRHDGATLKGHFSRIDFQRNPGGSPSAVLQLTESLPKQAQDIYYRDDIGNISTSSFSVNSNKNTLEFHIVPRFPLFGGWKNNWYTGYNLPLYPYLSYDSSSNYRLNVSFASDLGQVFVEDYTVRIILPEGASITDVKVPFSVDRSETKHFTYLDTTGRPVLVLTKRNVVPEHNVAIIVEYHFSWITKWHEPLLIAAAFFVLLSLVMVYVRFQLSIKPVDNTKTFQKRTEVVNALKTVKAKIDAELSRQNTAAEKATETSFRWNARPSVLDDLIKAAGQATTIATGESFSSRVKDFVEAQIELFHYQGKVHALRFSSGAKKTKVEKEKKLQEKFRAASDTVQQFVEDWIAL